MTVFLAAPRAEAKCGDFDGLSRFIGSLIGLGSATLTTFVAPAIAKGIRSDLPYWSGVGWTAASSFGGGLAGFGLTFVTGCDPYPESLYLPSALAVGFGIVGAVLWAVLTPKVAGTERSVSLLQFVVAPSADGAVAGVMGRF